MTCNTVSDAATDAADTRFDCPPSLVPLPMIICPLTPKPLRWCTTIAPRNSEVNLWDIYIWNLRRFRNVPNRKPQKKIVVNIKSVYISTEEEIHLPSSSVSSNRIGYRTGCRREPYCNTRPWRRPSSGSTNHLGRTSPDFFRNYNYCFRGRIRRSRVKKYGKKKNRIKDHTIFVNPLTFSRKLYGIIGVGGKFSIRIVRGMMSWEGFQRSNTLLKNL